MLYSVARYILKIVHFLEGPFDQIIKQITNAVRKVFDEGERPAHKKTKNTKGFAYTLLLVFLVGWLSTGIKKVNLEQLGVVLRFGYIQQILEPGLHFILPYPIDSLRIVDATSVRRIDSSNQQATVPVLTGDENIAEVQFYVLWNVKDPVAYLFSAKSPESTIQAAADSIVREIIAQNPFDKILTVSRTEIAQQAQNALQAFVDKCNLGIHVVEVQLGKVDPPSVKINTSDTMDDFKQECVIDAYREVQKAKADFERSRNEAESYRNYIIPTSRGEAEKVKQAAQAYKIRAIAQAEGDSARFRLLTKVYQQSPDIVMQRLMKEYREQVLSKSERIVLGSTKNSTPIFNLTPLPVESKGEKSEGFSV